MEGHIIHSPLCGRKVSRRHERNERSRHADLCRHGTRVGAVRQNAVDSEILRTHRKVEIGRIRIETDCPVNTCRLPLCLRRCREKECAFVERERGACHLCLRAVELCRAAYTICTSIECKHTIDTAQMQPHMIRSDAMNVHILRQGSLWEQF